MTCHFIITSATGGTLPCDGLGACGLPCSGTKVPNVFRKGRNEPGWQDRPSQPNASRALAAVQVTIGHCIDRMWYMMTNSQEKPL